MSKFKTLRHMETVRNYLNAVIHKLMIRGQKHDQSKLQSPEVEIFKIYTPRLRATTYRSKEYEQCIKDMKVAVDHHNTIYPHHPEHFILWKCVVCGKICKDNEKVNPPNDENKVFYCPFCCKHGMIYECSLERCSSIQGMTLIDLIEMMCDWKSASMRHADGDLIKSVIINQERFGYSDDLKEILLNTAKELEGWHVKHYANES